MAIAHLQKNQIIILNDIQYKLLRLLDSTKWQLESINTGELCIVSIEDLLTSLAEGKLIFKLDENILSKNINKSKNINVALDLLSKKEREQVKVKYLYVRELESRKIDIADYLSITNVIDEIWNDIKKPMKKPHWVTVYRWRSRYIKSGNDIRALISRQFNKGNRKRRYDQKLLDIIKISVDEIYLTRERRTIKDTVDHAIVLVKQENNLLLLQQYLPLPTRSLVNTAIRKISAYDLCVSRYGLQYAKKKFRSVLNNVTADRILERVEIDHTQLDLFIVDEDTCLPLGRPWITLCIDIKSRCIVGFNIGFEPPSYLTVARCLRHSFLPKLYVNKLYPNIKHDWPCFGVFETLVVDNGMEFHSKSLESACFSFGVNILFTPRKTPWFKGAVERIFQTLTQSTANVAPGKTFSNIIEKDDYDPVKHAVVSLTTLKEIIHIWIIDYYHQAPHRTLGCRPIDIWTEEFNQNEVPLPVNTHEFDALLGSIETRVLTHKGIELNKLFYNSQDLTDLRMQLGDKISVSIRYDEGNIGYIHVINPKINKAIKVPAILQSYANGMTLWQHKVCKKYAKRYFPTRTDIESLAEAKQSIRKLIMRDFLKKKTKSRSKMKRFSPNGISNDDGNKKNIDLIRAKNKKSHLNKMVSTSKSEKPSSTKARPILKSHVKKRLTNHDLYKEY